VIATIAEATPEVGAEPSSLLERAGAAMESSVVERTPAVTLRVAEGAPKDAGRGIARLDPRDLGRLGAEVGDVISISGGRITVARALPAYAEHRGQGVVQIDATTRANAQAGLSEPVQVARVPQARAERVVLRRIDETQPRRNRESRYVARLLESLPLIAGDRVRVILFGPRHQEFDVVSTVPKDGAVVVHPGTSVVLEGDGRRGERAGAVSWDDVGGLRKEIRRVREMVELPLRHPHLFQRLGIEAPRGVLLYGPPGTGKTLLARAVAYETDVAFLSVSGPEVIHKFYGESEAKLRGLFEQARKSAPCLVFIDEIDAIAPKRENVHGEVEKRVVAQLLALMDGLKDRGQVVVIAATNLPDLIDPALRRPGRFDREVEIGIPDAAARREILEIHARGMPLARDVDLDRLAAVTHGFVGADLQALCREAAMTTLRELLPDLELAKAEAAGDGLSDLQVTMAHFMAALAEVEPTAVREVVVEVPHVTWDEVGGLEAVKRELREAVEWPLAHPQLLQRAGVRPSKGILLYGPPGTGKTLLARALASEGGVNFISVKGPALLSKYVGESERAVREIFKKARQASPCVLLFDELDALAPVREAGADDAHVSARVIAQLLTEMDGVEDLKGVLVVGTTNRRDMLDPALLRPGRFDLLIEVPLPDAAARGEIFRRHLRDKPLAADVDAGELAKRTSGFSGADIETACRRAAQAAVRRVLPVGDDDEAAAARLKVTRADVLSAVAEQKTSRRFGVAVN
jgi:transitional endoplasmic reticulum ATPase